jgi:hypothetical protein
MHLQTGQELTVCRQLAPLIESKTIALRLEAQSEEAGYLAAIFPLPKTPTIVIIKYGP